MRIAIVDDEPHARSCLRRLLEPRLGIEVVAECGNSEEARIAVARLRPDALFIDIEMPKESGLSLARDMELAGYPFVIVTAHERYAAEAYDFGPVDYILKPPERSRCERAVNRLRRVLEARGKKPASLHYLHRLFVKDGDRLLQLRVADIVSIEGLGNYAKIRTTAATHCIRASLSALESRLDPELFARTHRSHIVNLSRVRELVALTHGDYQVVFDHGRTVPLSRVYREKLGLFVLPSAQDEPLAGIASA